MEPLGHRNKIVVVAARLHRARDRRATGLTLIEGPNLLDEAIRAGSDIRQIFTGGDDEASQELARQAGLDPVMVDPPALKRLAGTATPRGPIGVVAIPEQTEPGDQNLLVSWGVGDPGNVGTMIRIARAFGWCFGYTEGTADPWSPKVLRAGAGNQFATALFPVSGIDELKSNGYRPLATVVAGGDPPSEIVAGRWAVLIGEEAAGLPENVVAACERSLTISMPGGADSLNAAVAAGIVVHALSP